MSKGYKYISVRVSNETYELLKTQFEAQKNDPEGQPFKSPYFGEVFEEALNTLSTNNTSQKEEKRIVQKDGVVDKLRIEIAELKRKLKKWKNYAFIAFGVAILLFILFIFKSRSNDNDDTLSDL